VKTHPNPLLAALFTAHQAASDAPDYTQEAVAEALLSAVCDAVESHFWTLHAGTSPLPTYSSIEGFTSGATFVVHVSGDVDETTRTAYEFHRDGSLTTE
jgi:hypothetical protein